MEHADSSDRELELDAIIAAYIRASENGAQDHESWVRRHPSFRSELRQFFADRQKVERLISQRKPLADSLPPTESFVPSDLRFAQEDQTDLRPWKGRGTLIEPGEVLDGQYEVIDVKSGGMGFVYIVEDLPAKNEGTLIRYALKSVPDFERWAEFRRQRRKPVEPATYQDHLNRFRRECWSWVNLGKHRNIVHAISVVEIGERPYILMEYADSGDLATWISENRLSFSFAIDWAVQCCEGMSHAAQVSKIVHRDLKPANVLIHAGVTAKITDFGLAKTWLDGLHWTQNAATTQSDDLAESAFGGGTPAYMPPEQWFGLALADVRSDIFSFGVMLFEMLTGQQLFPCKPYSRVLEKGIELPKVHDVESRLPLELSTIVAKCLRLNPADRYESFSYLQNELQQVRASFKLDDFGLEKTGNQARKSSFRLIRPEHIESDLRFSEPRAQFEQQVFSLISLHRFDDAVRIAQNALEVDPSYDGHWINKGKAHAELTQFNQAVTCFETATRLNPGNALGWANLAFAYRGTGALNQAVLAALEATSRDHTCPEAWHARGCCELELERFDDAFESLTRAAQLAPADWRIVTNLGLCLSRMSHYAEAARQLQHAAQINPDRAMVWFELAWNLGQQGSLADARAAIDRCLSIDPSDSNAWAMRASILWDGGADAEMIVNSLKKALELNPKNENARMVFDAARCSGLWKPDDGELV